MLKHVKIDLGDRMKTKIYLANEEFTSGMTLKESTSFENNNMALHVAKDETMVIKNREKLAKYLGVELHNFVCADQTHSANFHKVTRADQGRGANSIETAIPNTDALYTDEAGIVLCCFTADCVPVMFHNNVSGIIGVIHSGWQGTVKQITLNVFRHLLGVEKCNPNDFYVQIGAALSQEKFEVDDDVYEKFHALGYANEFIYYKDETNKYHIDNQQTVKKQCELAGIPSEHISIDKTCTFLSSEGFSYREDKQTGRHLSFIMKK